jgi:hypothetical protein
MHIRRSCLDDIRAQLRMAFATLDLFARRNALALPRRSSPHRRRSRRSRNPRSRRRLRSPLAGACRCPCPRQRSRVGVDVARFGDDESALAFRQGIQAFPFKTYRSLDSTYGAGLVARAWDEFGAHACFVDDTGGFGSGWIDALRRLAGRRSASASQRSRATSGISTSARRGRLSASSGSGAAEH